MTDQCPECETELKQVTITESRPDFWGAPAYETIVIGLFCERCGYKEEF